MKMWSMNVIILLLFCYACLSTGNGRVYFISRNFYNVLHWDPAKPAFAGEKLFYSVQYRSDSKDQPYQIVSGCQNITALSCNLTAETPSVHDVYYTAQVSVNGHLHGRTNRFNPRAQTLFGPPILSTYTTVSSLHVNVALPLGPNRESIADIVARSRKGPIKNLIDYTLIITSPKWAVQVKKSTSGQFVINLKNNQTEYCGYVVYKPLSDWGRPESENASFCVTLPVDDRMLLPWPLMSAALLAAIVVILAVCSRIHVKGGKENRMPQSLVTISDNQPKVLWSPDRNLILSKPVVSTQSDQTVFIPFVSEGYSPQEIPRQAWQGSTGSSVGTWVHSPRPNQQDTSAQSSEIYSSVAVHIPAEENEDLQQFNIEGDLPHFSNRESLDKSGASPKLASHCAAPLPDTDACESNPAKPLLLHTAWDSNGQLMLPLLTFQVQKSMDSTVSPANPERKPLSSDLIDSKKEGPSLASLVCFDSSEWSDSGCDDSSVNTPTQSYCNTHYFPTQPVVPHFHQEHQSTPSSDGIFVSGYKQNLMPEIVLGTVSKDNCNYRKTNYPWTWTAPKKEEEGEEDEDAGGEEGSREILLGGWVVQIKE